MGTVWINPLEIVRFCITNIQILLIVLICPHYSCYFRGENESETETHGFDLELQNLQHVMGNIEMSILMVRYLFF